MSAAKAPLNLGTPSSVMAGLVLACPGHPRPFRSRLNKYDRSVACLSGPEFSRLRKKSNKTWMTGTSVDKPGHDGESIFWIDSDLLLSGLAEDQELQLVLRCKICRGHLELGRLQPAPAEFGSGVVDEGRLEARSAKAATPKNQLQCLEKRPKFA